MSDIKPLPCPWCKSQTEDDIDYVTCSNPRCDAMGPNVDTIESAVAKWNRIASLPDQHAHALGILRRIVNGYRPSHGPLDAWDAAAKLLREVDGGVIADTR